MTQYNKTTWLKNSQKIWIDIFPKKTYSQQTNLKKLNIANYYKNANQNCNEISPQSVQNGYHQKEHK